MQKYLIPLTCALLATARGADWPQYHGADSDRSSVETIANTDWEKSPPKTLWTAVAPTGFSSFIVADGTAFTVVQEEMDGVPSEICVAFDADTGETRWKANLDLFHLGSGGGDAGAKGNKGGDGPRSTPSYSDGRVYCYTAAMRLVCLSAKDGSELWAVDVIKAHRGENIAWDNASSPLVEGDLVIVAGGGTGQFFLAFDKESGALRWKSGKGKITHATPIATTIHGRRQVLFLARNGVVAVDPNNGKELWNHDFPFRTSTAASPVVEGDIVYLSAGYGVGATALRVDKGWDTEELWRSEGNKPVCNHWSTPLVKDGHLYGMFGFKDYGDGPLKCVELATGEVKWEKAGYGPGGVCLAGGVLVCLGDAGQLTLVEATPEGYRELARTEAIDGKCWSAPTLSDGKIYLRSTTGAACIDVR